MFCMDVRALYPSVPREEGREAVQEALTTREDQDTDPDTILCLMDFVLENNIF